MWIKHTDKAGDGFLLNMDRVASVQHREGNTIISWTDMQDHAVAYIDEDQQLWEQCLALIPTEQDSGRASLPDLSQRRAEQEPDTSGSADPSSPGAGTPA